jgi:hypothetical protein
MNPVEDRVQAAMAAAADLAAREIPSAPPLRLPPEPAAGDRRRHALRRPTQRRWLRWAAPLAAAAAVVALGVVPVLVKDMVPAHPAVSTGPGAVPRYYVALTQPAGKANSSSQGNGIVVGDSLIGKTLATFAPPAHMSFVSVTAAADDRTFVAFATTYPNASLNTLPKDTSATGTWYAVHLAPGSATPVRLSRLPIKPLTVHGSDKWIAAPQLAYSEGTVLSQSGTELAVPVVNFNTGVFEVQVFSVATGRLLHEWTTHDSSIVLEPSLTWIDGDRELALLSSYNVKSATSSATITNITVREWPVAGPTSGDLLADSEVVWELPGATGIPTTLQTCTDLPAYGVGSSIALISADGKTLSCAALAGSAGENHSFRTYPLTASTTATAQGKVDYQVTLPKKQGVYIPQVLWASPSGDTLIGAFLDEGTSPATVGNGPGIGAISHGKFTPLRFPPGFTLPLLTFPSSYIAW